MLYRIYKQTCTNGELWVGRSDRLTAQQLRACNIAAAVYWNAAAIASYRSISPSHTAGPLQPVSPLLLLVTRFTSPPLLLMLQLAVCSPSSTTPRVPVVELKWRGESDAMNYCAAPDGRLYDWQVAAVVWMQVSKSLAALDCREMWLKMRPEFRSTISDVFVFVGVKQKSCSLKLVLSKRYF